MDENSDSSWVLVNEVADEAVTFISLSSSAESDEDSDGSITILKDNPADSDLEENAGKIKSLEPTPNEDSSDPSNLHSEEIENHVEDVSYNTSDKSHRTDEWDNKNEVDYFENQIEELVMRQQTTPRERTAIKISVGLMTMTLFALITSHCVKEFVDINNIVHFNEEHLAPEIPTYILIDLCIYKQYTKRRYIEQTVMKCVNKKLRKLNIAEITENSYTHMHVKKRMIELEDELVSLENKYNPSYKPVVNTYTHMHMKKKMLEPKDEFLTTDDKFKPRHESNRKLKNLEKIKQEHKLKQLKQESNSKSSSNENQLKAVKAKMKYFWETQKFEKKVQKILKNLNCNEEWYVKYNPAKAKMEILNISSLSREESTLVKENNELFKLVNGEWYFKLFDTFTNEYGSKKKDSQWAFSRARYLAVKRCGW